MTEALEFALEKHSISNAKAHEIIFNWTTFLFTKLSSNVAANLPKRTEL